MTENQTFLAQRGLEEAKTRVDTLVREQQEHKVTIHGPALRAKDMMTVLQKEREAKVTDFEHNLMTSD